MQLENAETIFTAVNAEKKSGEATSLHLQAALDAVVRDSLAPISAGLGALYAILAVIHAFLLPRPAALSMSIIALTTALILLTFRLNLGRLQIAARQAHPISAGIAGLVLLNCFLHLHYVPEPQLTTNILLLIVGAGFLFLSTAWLSLIILASLGGWAIMAWLAPASPDWFHFGVALYMATVVAVLVHTVQVRTMRRLELLRLQDERRKAELETALTLTEEARRAAEATKNDLMQSETRLRLVTNQMPAVLWTTDTDLRVTSSLGMGLTVLDLQPHQVLDLMRIKNAPTTSPEFLPIAAHRRALQGESVLYEISWKDRTFGCQVEPWHDAERKLIGTIGIAFDITARQQAEEALRKSEEEIRQLNTKLEQRVQTRTQELRASEERFRQLYEDNPTMYFTVDSAGKVLSVNRFGAEQLGYTVEELLGQSVLKVFYEEDKTKAHAQLGVCLQRAEEMHTWELRKVRKNGSMLWVREAARATCDAGGNWVVLIVCEDITAQKLADEALQQSEERYRALYEDNPTMYFTVDAGGTVLSVNGFGAEQLGYSAEELVGRSVLQVFYSEDKAQALAHVETCLQNPVKLHTWELRKIRKDGSMLWVREAARATREANGNEVVLIVCEDITTRKRLEEEIQNYTEKLEQLMTARAFRIQTLERQRAESEKLAATGRMAAHIAHEIDNPLAGIKNSFLFLKTAVSPQHPDYHYATRLETEIARIARIVRQMFELYQPEQDSLREFQVQATIKDVVAMLKTSMHEHNVVLEVENIFPELKAMLSESALRQILYNVMQNAIDASPANGVVKISAAAPQNHLVITVADQGPGIPAEIRERIFEPFFTTPNRSGLGLGLSVTLSLVRMMRGSIDFESDNGKGTIFKIILPLRQEQSEAFDAETEHDMARVETTPFKPRR